MASDNNPELVVADPLQPAQTEVYTLAHQLLLDAKEPFDFSPSASGATPADMADRRASYVLEGHAISEEMSRFVGVAIDRYGIQAAMLPFSTGEVVSVPATGNEPDFEFLLCGHTDPLVSVDFFSYPLEPAGVRIEGVESGNSSREIDTLIESMIHPGLQEPITDRQKARYSNIGLKVMLRSSEVRGAALRQFTLRKEAEVAAIVAKDREGLGERQQREAELEELLWKADHPVRGTFKDAFRRIMRR